MKAKKHKLRFKPTPISRLNKMTVPFKMVGDPPWNWTASGKKAWESREKAVYAAMIADKTASNGYFIVDGEYAKVLEDQAMVA